ncbi:MAG: 3-hydroxyacyl-ACP dehydratase FabZ family protein [Syntrophobacteraceae bacterium]
MNMSTARDSGDGRLSAQVHIPANTSWFDGHFPGRPVLPGIAQLFMVSELIKQALNGSVQIIEVTRVRFKQTIVPDDQLSVAVEVLAVPGRYSFRIARVDEVVCTGVMTLAAM